MLKFLKYLIQIVMSPKNGWTDVEKANINPQILLSAGLYPLLGLTSLSCFVTVFYELDMTMVKALQNAIIVFISYFITYFFAVLIFSTFLSQVMNRTSGSHDAKSLDEKTVTKYVADERIYETFIIYNVAILALITLIRNLLPVEISLLQFLPFCVAFIMWKGTGYLSIPEKKTGQFMFLSVFSILLPVYLLPYLFHMIIR